jgi:hypothetical protein
MDDALTVCAAERFDLQGDSGGVHYDLGMHVVVSQHSHEGIAHPLPAVLVVQRLAGSLQRRSFL